MKVKDILSQLKHENPEAEVKPVGDGSGRLEVIPLPTLGAPILADEAAVSALGGHAARMERIRAAVEAFYGLPAAHKVHSDEFSECVELTVKSPTCKTMVSVELSIRYHLAKDEESPWRQQFVGSQYGSEAFKKFKDVPSDLAGYTFNVHKYVITGDKLRIAIQHLCEAPKWVEIQEE